MAAYHRFSVMLLSAVIAVMSTMSMCVLIYPLESHVFAIVAGMVGCLNIGCALLSGTYDQVEGSLVYLAVATAILSLLNSAIFVVVVVALVFQF